MDRGSVVTLFFFVAIVAIAGGIAWWALNQNSSPAAVTSSSGQAHGIPVVFTYTATKTEFPSGVFQIVDDTRILGANYVRPRNKAETVYNVLGTSAGKPLASSCHWVVSASIAISSPKLDTASYADISPMPAVVVADVTRIISHDEPRQICAGQ